MIFALAALFLVQGNHTNYATLAGPSGIIFELDGPGVYQVPSAQVPELWLEAGVYQIIVNWRAVAEGVLDLGQWTPRDSAVDSVFDIKLVDVDSVEWLAADYVVSVSVSGGLTRYDRSTAVGDYSLAYSLPMARWGSSTHAYSKTVVELESNSALVNGCSSAHGAGPVAQHRTAEGIGYALLQFRVAQPTRLELRYGNGGFASQLDAIRGGSQCFPVLPSGCPPPAWRCLIPVVALIAFCDPPLAYGYAFESSDITFRRIVSFPAGVDGDGLFGVSVGGAPLGVFSVDDEVDFEAILGTPVSQFEVTGIDPLVSVDDLQAFPIQLEFSAVRGEFSMTPLYVSASAVVRNATPNPLSLSCGAPVLGETMQANVALAVTGHPFAYLNAYPRPASIMLPGGQVLLGRGPNLRAQGDAVPRGLFRLGPTMGPNASFFIPFPLSASLVGSHMTLQATHAGGTTSFVLSSAVDLTLGF